MGSGGGGSRGGVQEATEEEEEQRHGGVRSSRLFVLPRNTQIHDKVPRFSILCINGAG